jgi:hypothetical protein
MKHSTDSSILVTKIRVPYENYKYSKVGKAFVEVSTRWHEEPWVKYLCEHGSINNVATYKVADDFSTVYILTWTINPRKKTLLLLQWFEQLNKIYS